MTEEAVKSRRSVTGSFSMNFRKSSGEGRTKKTVAYARNRQGLKGKNLTARDENVGRRKNVANRKEETEIINAVQRPERNGRPVIRLGMLVVKPCICVGSVQTIATGARAA